jgi:flagellar hook assembly protein FlgD
LKLFATFDYTLNPQEARRMNRQGKSHTAILLIVFFLTLSFRSLTASDYNVHGQVTDIRGGVVSNAKVTFYAGSTQFAALTGPDGYYTVRISGIYDNITGKLDAGIPYPNPFTTTVNIPFMIDGSGDVRLNIYSLTGQKIKEVSFRDVTSGSYLIKWDGCDQHGAPQRTGFYIYTISFNGETRSGKLIKIGSPSVSSSGTALVPVMLPPVTPPSSTDISLSVVTTVTCQGYYPVRLTDITISRDTVINFQLAGLQALPFKTSGDHIAMYTGLDYRALLLKGVNLGSSPPGYFPGEITYAITPAMYDSWISRIAQAGFNSIRVYTLHPPVFYEKLAEYNERHQDKPLLLFQGIWLDEVDDPHNPASYDLIARTSSFTQEIHDVIDCLHGNKSIPFRYGKAYGDYLTDVSRWIAGYIIGREISPQEVDSTNAFHPSENSYSGSRFSVTGASPTEVFVTHMLDNTVAYESQNYNICRPVSISSWPTLDPLTHPTEIFTDEDIASFDIEKIEGRNQAPGIFACYHAYPYYPNFISEQPSYRAYSDAEGPNSYLGYLNDLKNHYTDIPLVIGEFGVPSSWGSAHQSYSNMNHGGYSEQQQGEKDIRMLHNIVDAGCAGGFIFAWMDEWFKPTWIVSYLEAYGFNSDGAFIPTRQLWHNLTSPEQNYGLIGFDQTNTDPFIGYNTDISSGSVDAIKATNDNSFFYVDIETSDNVTPGDTMMVAFDTYKGDVGESMFPGSGTLTNRSEFMLRMVFGNDSATHYVTQAYDMNGLTLRFNLSDPSVQKYKSTVSDGAPWDEMQWINDGYVLTTSDIGRLPMENRDNFTTGERTAVAWNGDKIRIRIPWTMLYFYDPTQMKVNDGAVSYDGGWNFTINTSISDGIALSVYYKGEVTSTTDRYNWSPWLVVPGTTQREKKSLQVVESGLTGFPYFAE